MSETISLISNSNLFIDWLNAFNSSLTILATDVVTANSVAGGSQTTGNAYVTGIFGASNLVATNIGGGNVTSSANLTLTSNLISGNCSLNTTSVGFGSAFVYSVNVQTSGLSSQLIDQWLYANSRGAEYILVVTNNPANGTSFSKINILTDGTTAYITEYGQLFTNGSLGVFSATISGADVKLNFTPSQTNCQIKGTATLIAI